MQSVAAEVIAALDVDVEALGGRRDIVMPTLDKVTLTEAQVGMLLTVMPALDKVNFATVLCMPYMLGAGAYIIGLSGCLR